MEYTLKKLVARLAAKQLSENIFNSKTKGTVHLQVRSNYLKFYGHKQKSKPSPLRCVCRGERRGGSDHLK